MTDGAVEELGKVHTGLGKPLRLGAHFQTMTASSSTPVTMYGDGQKPMGLSVIRETHASRELKTTSIKPKTGKSAQGSEAKGMKYETHREDTSGCLCTVTYVIQT